MNPMAGDKTRDALVDADHRQVLHPFSTLNTQLSKDVFIVSSAKGIHIVNDRGNEFIDAGGGLWNVNVGYGREDLIAVATAQMTQLSFAHCFSNFSNKPLIRLTEKLLALAPSNMKRVTYTNSGSEANDTQVKLVWRYNNLRGKPKKKKIISRRGGYHGATLGAANVNGLSVVHRTFDLPQGPFIHTEPPEYHRRTAHIKSEDEMSRDLAQVLDKLIEAEGPDTVAAFVAEPIMGSAGVITPSKGYFEEINKVLKKHDVLMVADEVITGFGRTGAWFASAGLNVEPDLITIGKGLTSGYFPMSGCLISDKVCDVLYAEKEAEGYFGSGFTTSGHPVGAAVALANIGIIEGDDLLGNSVRVGHYLLSRFQESFANHEFIGDIRGKGLIIGVEFDQDVAQRKPFDDPARVAGMLSQACWDEKLIVRGGHGRVVACFAPPLTLTMAEADEIVARFEKAVARFCAPLRASSFSTAISSIA
jgi:L-2,4-diaminobutyrate transaminase